MYPSLCEFCFQSFFQRAQMIQVLNFLRKRILTQRFFFNTVTFSKRLHSIFLHGLDFWSRYCFAEKGRLSFWALSNLKSFSRCDDVFGLVLRLTVTLRWGSLISTDSSVCRVCQLWSALGNVDFLPQFFLRLLQLLLVCVYEVLEWFILEFFFMFQFEVVQNFGRDRIAFVY